MSLRILIVHNRYRTPGGEDTVVSTEAALLRACGHEVGEFFDYNGPSFGMADLADPIWSLRTAGRLRRVLEEFRPDIVHCHNLYYRISPSAYWLCYRLGIPVVQTLHNFRFACLNARLSRDGMPCELCLSSPGSRFHGVLRGCFQKSRLKSTVLAISNEVHEALGSFSRPVARFIALSRFARSKHILAGIPEGKLIVKSNCVYPDPGVKTKAGTFCFFAGRLDVDKGTRVLLQAASLIPHVPIVIAGQGPLESEVRQAATALKNVRYLGPVPRNRILDLMKSARFLLFPSLAYENFPMTIAEAFSVGLPVVASRLGAAGELVQDSVNGIHFEPGSATDLARRVGAVWEPNGTIPRMGAAARACYEENYSGESTYRALCSIYQEAIESCRPSLEGHERPQ
jgi:glycosyltransferase involved in cell wall biosynthesis